MYSSVVHDAFVVAPAHTRVQIFIAYRDTKVDAHVLIGTACVGGGSGNEVATAVVVAVVDETLLLQCCGLERCLLKYERVLCKVLCQRGRESCRDRDWLREPWQREKALGCLLVD